MDLNLGKDGGFARRAAESILAELRDAPVLETALKSRIRERVHGFSPKDYKAVLDDLVAARKIHGTPKLDGSGKPTRAVKTYVFGPPTPERVILKALEAGPLTPKELKAKITASITGLSAKECAQVLTALSSRSEIHARFKLGKSGKPMKTVETYVLGKAPPPPPAPGPFVRPVITAWKKALESALKGGVSETALLAALVEALGVDAGLMPAARVAPAEARERVLAGVRRLVRQEGAGALIPIRKLRALVALPKADFDAAMFSLRDDESVILHHHEYVGSLTDTERAELVVDGYGNYYMGVALRGES